MSRKKSYDAEVFIGFRYFSFMIAVTVSVFLNVIFFQSLDTGSYWWVLLCISVLLESAKISTLLTKNIFVSLYEKTKEKKVKSAVVLFFGSYLAMATLSVMAGLGFSVVVTSKSADRQASELQMIENHISEIESLETRRATYLIAKDITLSAYPPYAEADAAYVKAQAEQEEAERNYYAAIAERNRYPNDPESEMYELRQAAQREVNAQDSILAAANSAFRNARDRRNIAKTEFEELKENSDARISELNDEFALMTKNMGIESATPRLAVLELEQNLKDLKNKIMEEKGMGYMFDLMSAILKVPADTIKFIILLFVAFLIELVIYQSSPDIRTTRNILYFFRRHISTNIDVQQLLSSYDEENIMFDEQREQKPLTKSQENDEPKKVVRKKMDSSQEQVDEEIKKKLPEQKREQEHNNLKVSSRVKIENSSPITMPIDSSKPLIKEDVSEDLIDFEEEVARELEELSKMVQVEQVKRVEQVEQVERVKNEPPVIIENTPEVTPEVALENTPESKLEDKPEGKPEDKPESVIEVKGSIRRKIPEEPIIKKRETLVDEFIKEVEEKKEQALHTIHFRFGRTTQKIADKLIEFIKLCIDGPGKFIRKPDEAADLLKLNRKAKEVFINHLSSLKMQNEQLIMRNKNGEYVANFSADEIIKYATEILED